jgi:hypothetical protein
MDVGEPGVEAEERRGVAKGGSRSASTRRLLDTVRAVAGVDPVTELFAEIDPEGLAEE